MGWSKTRLIWRLDRFGFIKRLVSAMIRSNPVNPWPEWLWRNPAKTRCCFFFFQMWDLKFISIYSLCSQEKSYFFFQCKIWNTLVYILYVYKKKTIFFQYVIWNSLVHILYVPKKKVKFFQYGIWNPLVYILYVHKKKTMFFQYEIKKNFGLNSLT